MTSALPFAKKPNPAPTSARRRAEILSAPGFGNHFTDNMVTVEWDRGRGWHDAAVVPYGPLSMQPSAMVLHYGQAIFEGLKAYRQPDGSIASFRPEANAERMRASARRMAMPELPDETFLASLRELIAVDGHWVPAAGSEESLYLRPLAIATEGSLGVRPARSYRYLLIASPAGAYFPGGVKPVSVWISTDYVRAAPGGTGDAKCAGNYAASLLAQAQAAEQGCDQVVWLDAVERRWIEEVGVMNLFFVFGSGDDVRLVTPELTGTLLPGITRRSIIEVAADLGFETEERRICTDELEKAVASGEVTEVFACGTAAVITPVGRVKHADGEYLVNNGVPGDVTLRLREALTAIQRGSAPDTHHWLTRLD
jgi:branched-chain amino acid aminotransferase